MKPIACLTSAPGAWIASIARRASLHSAASGFSHRIALPALAAASITSAWWPGGVQMSTMSTSAQVTTARQSVTHRSKPYAAAAEATAVSWRPLITRSRGRQGSARISGAVV